MSVNKRDQKLTELREQRRLAVESFQYWKGRLYEINATAKLGDSKWEQARVKCREATAEIDRLDREIRAL